MFREFADENGRHKARSRKERTLALLLLLCDGLPN
jgi:hypothetical protein